MRSGTVILCHVVSCLAASAAPDRLLACDLVLGTEVREWVWSRAMGNFQRFYPKSHTYSTVRAPNCLLQTADDSTLL